MANILLTGASSKLAYPLLQKLVLNHHVIAVTRKKNNLKTIIKNVHYIELDLLNEIHLDLNIDYIIHLAAYVPYNFDLKNDTFKKSYIDNVQSTNNLLTFAIDKQVKKFIFASSIDVYGTSPGNTITEYQNCTPDNYYGLSKMACEDLLNVYFHNNALNYTSFRIGYVLGKDMDENRFLKSLLTSIERNEDLSLYNPDNILNIIHVDEVADAIYKSLTGPNGTYNLSKGTTLHQFVETAKKQINSTSKITYTNDNNISLKKYSNHKLLEHYRNVFTRLEETIQNTMETR